MDHTAQWPAVVSAFASTLLALTALGALIAATGNWRAAKAANEQAKRDSVERTRPYVFVEVSPSIGADNGIDVLIRNSGSSAARQVVIDFDGWPDDPDDIAQAAQKVFETPRTIAPGSSVRIYWMLTAHSGQAFEDGREEAGIDTPGTATIRYTSDDPAHPEYEDRYEIDVPNLGHRPTGYRGVEPPPNPSAREFYKLGQRALSRLSEISGK